MEDIDVSQIFIAKCNNKIRRLLIGYIDDSCDFIIANMLVHAKNNIELFNEEELNNLSVVSNVINYGK